MNQHKKVSQIENNWSLYDLIDAEMESELKPTLLDKCPDIDLNRFNELVLDVIKTWNESQKKIA